MPAVGSEGCPTRRDGHQRSPVAVRRGGVTPPGARQVLGAEGERRAATWYEAHGYQVVDRNWRCALGEIDLICRRDGLVVIVEVKTRASTTFGHPAEAVTPAKQRRLRKLAGRWLEGHRDRSGREIRFDVVAVLGEEIQVIEGAFP